MQRLILVVSLLSVFALAGCIGGAPAQPPSNASNTSDSDRIPRCESGEIPCRWAMRLRIYNNKIQRIPTPVGENVTLKDTNSSWWHHNENHTVTWLNKTITTEEHELVIRTRPPGCSSSSCSMWGRTENGEWHQSLHRPDTSGTWRWDYYIPDPTVTEATFTKVVWTHGIKWNETHG